MTDMAQWTDSAPAGISSSTGLDFRPKSLPSGTRGTWMLCAMNFRNGRTPSLAISCFTIDS